MVTWRLTHHLLGHWAELRVIRTHGLENAIYLHRMFHVENPGLRRVFKVHRVRHVRGEVRI